MPEEYVRLSDVVDIVGLQRRWPGVEEDEIVAMVEDKALPAFWEKKRLKSPEGTILSFCTPGAKPGRSWQGETIYYEWGAIVFSLENVACLEEQHPEFKWNPPDAEGQNQAVEPESEWVRCNTLPARWDWSPFSVINVLGFEPGQLRYDSGWMADRPTEPGELIGCTVHVRDLLDWEIENADKIRNAPVQAEDGQRLREENEALVAKVSGLEAQNTALCSELEAERAKVRIEAPKRNKTASATEAASSKGVEKWKGYAAQMVKVSLDCFKEGPKARKRPQLKAIVQRHGELPATAFEVLWKALPNEHKSTEAGAPRQD